MTIMKKNLFLVLMAFLSLTAFANKTLPQVVSVSLTLSVLHGTILAYR